MEVNNIDDFIKTVYPVPTLDDGSRHFYDAWGYEQWLIRTHGHDLEQLRILLMNDYNRYRFSKYFDGVIADSSYTTKLVGLPLVRTKKIIRKFFSGISKGDWGILIFRDDSENLFCYFPRNTVISTFNSADIEITDENFTTEEALIEKINSSSPHIWTVYQLKGQYIKIPGHNDVYYIYGVWTHGVSSRDATLKIRVAVPKKNGKGYKVTGKVLNIEITEQDLEDTVILE